MPGYSDQIYNYILKLDPTYKNDVSLQLFKSKMANPSYSRKIYDWIGTADTTFKSDVSFDAFNAKLGYPKKKVTTVSPGNGAAKPSSSGALSKAVNAGVQKIVEAAVKPSGSYRYPGREDAVYKKTNNQWYIDLGETGNYVKVNEKSRISALEKYAKTYTPIKTKEFTTVKSTVPEGVSQKINKEITKAVVNAGQILAGEKKPTPQKYEAPKKYTIPGKTDKEYELVYTESGVPVWNESVIQYQNGKPLTWKNEKTGKTGYVFDYKQVKDPKRVATLNKMFNQSASSSTIEQTYVGYPGKDDVEYRIGIDKATNEPYWEKRPKGYSDFFRITQKGSIDALNAQFNKQVKYDAARDKFSGVAEDVELIKKKEFDTNLLSVNSSLIGNDQDIAIKKLKAKFPNFKFRPAAKTLQDVLGDYVEVFSPDEKNSIKISLDNWTDAGDSEEARRLRQFIKVNASKDLADASKSLDVAEKENDTRVGVNFKSRRAVPGDPEYDINRPPDQQAIVTRTEYVTKEEKTKTEEKARLARKDYARETYLNLRDIYYKQKKAIETGKNPYDDKEVENMVAYLPNDKETVGNASKFADDINKSFQNYNAKIKLLQIYADDANERIRSGKISEEEFNEQYKPKMEQLQGEIKQMGVDLKDETKYLGTITKSVDESIAAEYVVNEARGTFLGGVSKKYLKGLTALPRLGLLTKDEQEGIVNFITGDYTTEEYMNSKNRSDITKAIFSLGESLGALTTGVALGGGASTYASFFAQSYNEMKDELDMIKDPSGAGPSEFSKILMSGTYGVVSSILEKFGLDLALQKTGLGRQITHAVIKDAFMDIPENASKEFIQAAIVNSTKKMFATLPMDALIGGAGEGLTEMTQAVSKIGIQEVYDGMVGSDYFNNKSAREIYADVLYEGYLGALGGGIMSTVTTASTITGNKFRENLNKEQLEVLMNAAKMENIDQALLANLKAGIISGKYTKEQAKQISNSFKDIQGRINSMPDDMSVEDKSVALDLMTEKANLEKYIANKDENLAAPQRRRIAEINVELIKISENAVQKQTTSEVPVQPEAAVSGEMAQGVSQAEPQVTTQEGEQAVQEEVAVTETPRAAVVSEAINRPATLTSFGGTQLDAPLSGDVYVEGQQVVFEDRNSGKIYELGNVDEVMNSELPGLEVQEERVSVTPQGQVSIDGNNWNMQMELPTQGIEYNPAGEVISVSLKNDAGQTQMFTGQDAVDIAYQIELQKIQTPEQQQFINDLLEQDEEFQAATESIQLPEVTTPIETTAVEVPVQAQPTVEPTAAQPTAAAVEPATQPVETEVVAEEEVAKTRTKEEIDADVALLDQLLSAKSDRGRKQVEDKKSIDENINKAKKAISRILPNVKFIVHDTDDSYRNATGEIDKRTQTSSGTYIPGDKNTPGEIHINRKKANKRTAAHEVFHAILLNSVSTNEEAQKVTKNMINAVIKSLNNISGGQDIKNYLNDFASNYDENLQDEEKLSELLGILASEYKNLPPASRSIIKRFLDRIAKIIGIKPITDSEVINFMNTVSEAISQGKELTTKDILLLKPKEQGDGGEVGTLSIPRQQKDIKIIKAPSVKNDERSFIRNIVEDVDLREFNGKKFITNMYDYTNAGETDLGNGLVINLFGGKNYVPYMMELKGKNTGDVSNLAAFNTKAQAETFIRNSINGNADLFAPHSGTKDQSWQFQQHMFAELVDLILNNGILSNSELISLFNETIKTNKDNIKAFNAFKGKLGKKIKNFDSFKSNPLEIVRLLDIENNFSPDLRKALNNAIPANKKFKSATGINNKQEFYDRIMDPLNKGVEGGELMSIVQFDPNTFEIVQTKPGDIDHHPSFGWTLLAKIDGVYQPTEFYKSYDVTDTYTKYNKNKTEVSRKAEDENFVQKNVTSSAGAIPKVAKITPRKQIVGENANLSQNVRDNLQVARDMEDAGKSVKDVRIATGWERGTDNKWRYEVPDNIPYLKDTVRQVKELLFGENLENLGQKAKFFLPKELINMYPKLNDVTIFFNKKGNEGEGSYSSKNKEIQVNIGVYPNNTVSALLHEVQHAIQEIEGFSRGGNINMMKTPNDVIESLADNLPKLTKEQKSEIKNEYVKNGLSRLPVLPTRLDVTSDSIDTIEDLIDKLDVLIKLFPNESSYKNLQDALDLKLMEIGGKDVAFEKYQKIAGEVEARNVETRMKMTPEERRQTTLQETEDVSREDQTLFFGKITPRQQKLAPNGKKSNLNDTQWEQVRTPEFKKWFGDWENDPKNASKVVDENGEPLVVYHGSLGNFDEFETGFLKSRTGAKSAEMGFFFSDDKRVADSYVYFGQLQNPNINDLKPIIYGMTREQLGDFQSTVLNKFDDSDSYSDEDLHYLKDDLFSYVENDANEHFLDSFKYIEKAEKFIKSRNINKEFSAYPKGYIYESFLNIRNPKQQNLEGDYFDSTYVLDVSKNNDGVILDNAIDSVSFEEKAGGIESKIVIAFKPNQIKSATENVGTFSQEEASIRKQQPSQNNIDYIVATARANNIKDDAIEVYLRNNGFSDADIIQAMTQMKPAKDITVEEIYKQSQDALKRRYDANIFVRAYRYANKAIFDRQEGIKRLMKGIKNEAAKRAFNMLITKAGATGFASYRFKRIDRVVYGGLDSKSLEILNQIIYARRIIDINVNRRNEGKSPYTGINGYNEANAMADLNRIRESIGENNFDNLNKRAKRYFLEFNDNLRILFESGRINEETYLRFKDREYSPIKVIKYIIGDNANPGNADSQASTLGVSRKDIQALSDKNENDIIMDSRWLLMMNIHTVAARAFENDMLVAWAEAIETATQEEKDAISKYIKENPMTNMTSKGPKYKYGLGDFSGPNQKAELVGFTPITYFVNGEQRILVVDSMYANQILDIKNVELNNKMRKVGQFTGVGILRYMATVGNPLFIIGNVPVDIFNATFLTNVYSWFKPLAIAQATTGFSMKFIRGIYDDIRSIMNDEYENKLYREYVEHGGAIDFLSQDGIVGIKSMLSAGSIKSYVAKPFLAVGACMSYLGTKSEFAMRIAVYSKQKNNLIAKYKKENNGQEPTGQALDDIMWDAAREARELVDFSQGGSTIKTIDPVMPYLNAATQGVRKSVKFAKENPIAFGVSMSQVALAAGGMAYYSLAMALSAIDGDDEEEKMRKLKDALDSVPAHTKAGYHVVFTGKKDKDGNLQYAKIKKLPVVSILTTIIEQYAYKMFFEMGGSDYNVDTSLMYETFKKSMPIWPTELAGKNPGVAAYIALSYNIDTFTGKEIFKQPRDKKIKEEYQGVYDNKIEEFYKVIAPAFKMSPAKTKVAIEKIITSPSTNPMVHIAYAAMNGIFGATSFVEDIKACGNLMIESAGNKLVKYTDPDILSFVRQDKMKDMETSIESEIWMKEQSIYNKINKVYDGGKEMSYGELTDIITENFEGQDVEKYIRKYDTYIRNRNLNKGMLDIVYETVPEVQAYKLYMEFGPKMSGDEMAYLQEIMGLSGEKVSDKAFQIYYSKYGK